MCEVETLREAAILPLLYCIKLFPRADSGEVFSGKDISDDCSK